MDSQKVIENIVRSFVGQRNIIAVQKEFVYFLDYDHAAAIMLSQLIYWSDRTINMDGWIYKSAEDWNEEIAIAPRQTDRVKAKLIEKGYIETEIRKANGAPTTHYRVRMNNLINALVAHLELKNDQSDNTKSSPVNTKRCDTLTPNGEIINSNYNNNYTVSQNTLTDEPQVTLSGNTATANKMVASIGYAKPKPVKQPKKYALSTDEVVTDIIRNSDKAKTAVSSDIPEIYIPYAKAFIDGTGIKYIKKYFSDWVSTFSDWITLGYSPVDVRNAIDAIIDEGKSEMISRPGSIQWKLNALSVRKRDEPKERVYKDVTGMED